jgi:hypothetical protein
MIIDDRKILINDDRVQNLQFHFQFLYVSLLILYVYYDHRVLYVMYRDYRDYYFLILLLIY